MATPAEVQLQVSMKTHGVINPLGEIIAHDVTFQPNVNVYDRAVQEGIERVIRIECPGVHEDDIRWEAGKPGERTILNNFKHLVDKSTCNS